MKKENIDIKMKSVLDQRVSSLKTCYEFIHPSTVEEKAKLDFYIDLVVISNLILLP